MKTLLHMDHRDLICQLVQQFLINKIKSVLKLLPSVASQEAAQQNNPLLQVLQEAVQLHAAINQPQPQAVQAQGGPVLLGQQAFQLQAIALGLDVNMMNAQAIQAAFEGTRQASVQGAMFPGPSSSDSGSSSSTSSGSSTDSSTETELQHVKRPSFCSLKGSNIQLNL